MKNLFPLLILLAGGLLITDNAQAQTQTCIPQWCGAPWPPGAGEHMTAGLDNCKETCVKMGSVTGFKVIYNKGNNTFHETIDADMMVVAPTYLIFKKAGQEVARFEREFIVGWKTN